MQKADPLIRTKLRLPLTRPGLIPRPRLQEQLALGLRGPLTLVTAPAGFGKTTLVASYIAGCGMLREPPLRVAWLSLDKNDNQVGRFLNYLIAAVQEADHEVGSEAVRLLADAQQTPPEAVLTSLINDLDTSRTEMALVLDDYQFISSQAVHDAVGFLLDHCPNTFHLMIATRSDPPLPLARLRARGQTVELRAADLRFTEAEAVQFLIDVMGLHLDAGSVSMLEDRTEGWIAGLQMAALSLRGREDVGSFLKAFAGTNRFIMDFMLEEVLAREPEKVQAFLLQTSILTRLSGPLCDAVTGASGSQEMIETLEKRNLFVVPLDDERRWYRYHHLFADLLQARLYQSGPQQAARLLSRAAEWCEQDGQVAEAVNYAFAAQDYGRAAELVERHWQQMSNTGEIDTVWSWLNALPEDLVRDSAPLSAAYCGILWLTGQPGAIETHLVDAERALAKLDASNEPDHASAAAYAQLRAALAAMRSFVARYHEEYDTARAIAEHALSLIPRDQPSDENAQLYTLAFLALASACDGAGELEKAVEAYAETIRWSRLSRNAAGIGITYRLAGALRLLGRMREAEMVCRDALEYLQAQGMARLPAAGILHLAMSEVLVERNDLEAAEAHLAQGIALGKWSGRLDAVKNAPFVLSRLRLIRNDANGAHAAIEEAEAAIGSPVSPLAKADLLALKVRILVWQGAVNQAAQCAAEAARLIGRDCGQTGELVSLAVARVLAARILPAQSQPDAALEQLAQSIAAAEKRLRMGAVIELRILRGLALARLGSAAEAEADLERALALAEPEGYARIFLDEGQPMQQLLAHWLAHAGAGSLRDYATHLLTHLNAELLETNRPAVTAEQSKELPVASAAQSANNLLVEPLSDRELEVLRLMAGGKTNPEIARQLIVAPGTIKAHAASIYRKLDAANRTEAVSRARQLGILP